MEIVHDATRPRALHARGGEGLERQPGADRPLPERRDRGRRRLRSPTATDVFIAGIMEHIEQAGVHSGDSACSLPPYSLPPRSSPRSSARPSAMAKALKVVGLMNVQFAIKDGDGLRARGQSARLPHRAVRRQGDRPAARQDRRARDGRRVADSRSAIKKATRQAHRGQGSGVPVRTFPGVDIILGPGDEVDRRGHGRSTTTFGRAFVKSQLGAGIKLPRRRHGVRLGQGPATRRAMVEAGEAAARARLPARRDRRHGRLPRRAGIAVAARSTRCSRAGRTSST